MGFFVWTWGVAGGRDLFSTGDFPRCQDKGRAVLAHPARSWRVHFRPEVRYGAIYCETVRIILKQSEPLPPTTLLSEAPTSFRASEAKCAKHSVSGRAKFATGMTPSAVA